MPIIALEVSDKRVVFLILLTWCQCGKEMGNLAKEIERLHVTAQKRGEPKMNMDILSNQVSGRKH